MEPVLKTNGILIESEKSASSEEMVFGGAEEEGLENQGGVEESGIVERVGEEEEDDLIWNKECGEGDEEAFQGGEEVNSEGEHEETEEENPDEVLNFYYGTFYIWCNTFC